MTGWQCPGCSRCYAPSVPECSRCGQFGTASGVIQISTCDHAFDTNLPVPKCKKCGTLQFGITYGVKS